MGVSTGLEGLSIDSLEASPRFCWRQPAVAISTSLVLIRGLVADDLLPLPAVFIITSQSQPAPFSPSHSSIGLTGRPRYCKNFSVSAKVWSH